MNRDLTTTHNLCPVDGATWQLRTHELKTVMGCTPGPKGGLDWPRAGILPGHQIGNVWVKVLPRNTNGRSHRAIAVCPYCGNDIPAGRLHQHLNARACLKVKPAKPTPK